MKDIKVIEAETIDQLYHISEREPLYKMPSKVMKSHENTLARGPHIIYKAVLKKKNILDRIIDFIRGTDAKV